MSGMSGTEDLWRRPPVLLMAKKRKGRAVSAMEALLEVAKEAPTSTSWTPSADPVVGQSAFSFIS
jgi:hypothetical protein